MEELEFRYDTQLLIDGSSKKDLNEDKILYSYVRDYLKYYILTSWLYYNNKLWKIYVWTMKNT